MLIEKLSLYHFDKFSLKLLNTFLTERIQLVTTNGSKSYFVDMNCGVAQVSILGPLLFIVYINDLPLVVNSPALIHADGSIIYTSRKSTEIIEEKLNRDTNNIEEWCNQNNLVLNSKKTNCMSITTCQRASRLQCKKLIIKLNGEDLERVESMKFLGVTIDKYLDFNEHINAVSFKMTRNLALFNPICKEDILFFFSPTFFDYCSIIWGSGRNLSRISKLQRRAIRMIVDTNYRTDAIPLFKSLKIFILNDRMEFQAC